MSFPVSQLVMKSWMWAVVNPRDNSESMSLSRRQVAVVVITHVTAFLRRRQQSPLLNARTLRAVVPAPRARSSMRYSAIG